jgi:hypothetical protein
MIVYPSGLVCISILHPPGDDPNHYEHASERWSPIQSVEKILISVMSMLAEPNDERLRCGGNRDRNMRGELGRDVGGCWGCEWMLSAGRRLGRCE